MNTLTIKIIAILNKIIEDGEFTDEMIDDDLMLLGMDSISFVKIIIEIEDTYDLEMPDKYLVAQKMNTIAKICNAVAEQIGMSFDE